jgi:vancomycin resistance protein YoaR
MNNAHALPLPSRDPYPWTRRILLALVGAGLAVLAATVVCALGARLVYAGRALPGVTAAGVNVRGMNRAQIEAALDQALAYPDQGIIVLHDGARRWIAQPRELGVTVDVRAMAQQALAVGREGSLPARLRAQLEAWLRGRPIGPILVFDQNAGAAYLRRLAQQIDQPPVEASLAVEGLEVVMRAGQIGRLLDLAATLGGLTPVISRMYDADVPLVINETPPRVLDASEEAALVRSILSQPLTLTVGDTAVSGSASDGPWTLEPAALAPMLRFDEVTGEDGSRYEVNVDPGQMTAFLEPLAADLERQPENARFIFIDETRQLDLLREAIIGRSLDLPASIQAVTEGLNAGQHELPLAFQLTEPEVGSEATAESLEITENVVTVSTYFAGSSAARIQNITTAAAAFHGLLIAPGQTLSMADVLGDISLETGYAEALIILGDRTINGVGGGVCQVSTTLFRAAFFGGYPIDERHPHAYLVSYYQQGPHSPGPGLDATVFAPLVDFRFTNDSPYWLLMETYIYGTRIEWKFYSTSDGRQVDWTTTGPQDVVDAPEPLYRENPELHQGVIKQVDYQADGMNVTVTRTVTRDGQIIYDDVFRTHYLPWRAIYEYGPGTELPEDALTE